MSDNEYICFAIGVIGEHYFWADLNPIGVLVWTAVIAIAYNRIKRKVQS